MMKAMTVMIVMTVMVAMMVTVMVAMMVTVMVVMMVMVVMIMMTSAMRKVPKRRNESFVMRGKVKLSSSETYRSMPARRRYVTYLKSLARSLIVRLLWTVSLNTAEEVRS